MHGGGRRCGIWCDESDWGSGCLGGIGVMNGSPGDREAPKTWAQPVGWPLTLISNDVTLSWYNLISPPLSTSTHLHLPPPASVYVHPPPSMSACHPWLLQSILAVHLHNYVVPTVGLTSDQGQTCLDLVPMPRAATHMPFSPFVLFAWFPFIGNNG